MAASAKTSTRRTGPNSHSTKATNREHGGCDPRPLVGYAVVFSGYVALTVALVLAARRRGRAERAPGPFELALLALATMHLSRLIAKDSIAAFVRAPFIRFEGPAGEGEVNEVVIGTGLSHAFGKLITCPFCLAQWAATGLVAGRTLAPRATAAVVLHLRGGAPQRRSADGLRAPAARPAPRHLRRRDGHGLRSGVRLAWR